MSGKGLAPAFRPSLKAVYNKCKGMCKGKAPIAEKCSHSMSSTT